MLETKWVDQLEKHGVVQLESSRAALKVSPMVEVMA
jgi:hypothetical protein